MKTFNILIITLILSFYNMTSYASVKDKIDSLEKKLVNAHDTDKFDICYALVYYYQNTGFGKSIYYLQKSLYWAKYSKNLKRQAQVTRDLGLIYYYKNEYDKAISFYLEAIKIFNKIKNFKGVGNVYHDLGNLYWTQAKYSKAVEYYLAELHLCEKNADSTGIARALGSIAFIYELSGEHDKALKMQFQVLSIWTKIANKQGIGVTLTNIGNIYKVKQQDNKALEYYYKAIKAKREFERPIALNVTYLNIGDVYYDMKKFDSAYNNYQKAIHISEAFFDYYTSSYSHLRFAQLYIKLGNPDSLKIHLDKAFYNAKKAKTADGLKQIYKEYSAYYASVGKYNESYNALKKYTEIADSLLPNEAMQKVAVYELEKIQTNLQILEKEKEIASLKSKKTRNQRNFLILFSVLVLLLTMAIYNRFLTKKKTNIALEKVNQTKDKFFTIISHDLKNQLTAFQNISQVLAENFQQIGEEKKHQLIIRINVAASTLYEVLENLLTWSSTQLRGIDFLPKRIVINDLINHVLNELKLTAEKKKILLINEVGADVSVWADENMVMNIIRNLSNNAIKFSKENSEVRISGIRRNEIIEISIIDNGIGISKADLEKLFKINVNNKEIGSNKDKGSGLGLVISKEFVEKMGGKIWAESEEGRGSIFTFSLPINV